LELLDTTTTNVTLRHRNWIVRKSALHPGAQLFRNAMSVDAVANDLWSNEDDELRALRRSGRIRKKRAKPGDLIEHGNSGAPLILGFTDEAGKQYRLAAGDRNEAAYLTLRYRPGSTWPHLRYRRRC
jgi:hypothetical protein